MGAAERNSPNFLPSCLTNCPNSSSYFNYCILINPPRHTVCYSLKVLSLKLVQSRSLVSVHEANLEKNNNKLFFKNSFTCYRIRIRQERIQFQKELLFIGLFLFFCFCFRDHTGGSTYGELFGRVISLYSCYWTIKILVTGIVRKKVKIVIICHVS